MIDYLAQIMWMNDFNRYEYNSILFTSLGFFVIYMKP